jgi:hypothetical protein
MLSTLLAIAVSYPPRRNITIAESPLKPTND